MGDATIRFRPHEDARLTFGEHLDVHIQALPDYDGPLVVTPSDVAQTLPFAGHSGVEDVVVAPIPSSWGRIVYTGGIITVI